MSKYWSEMKKAKAPRDIIYAMEIPNTSPVEHETKTKNMAELARNYRHNLLQAGIDTPPDVQEDNISEVLASVLPENTMSDVDSASFKNKLSEQDVLEALMASKSGTSTGLNGTQ